MRSLFVLENIEDCLPASKKTATQQRTGFDRAQAREVRQMAKMKVRLELISKKENVKLPQKKRLCKNQLDEEARLRKQNLQKKLEVKLAEKNAKKPSPIVMSNEDLEQISEMIQEFQFEKYRQTNINHHCLALIEPKEVDKSCPIYMKERKFWAEIENAGEGGIQDSGWTRFVRAPPMQKYYENLEKLSSDPLRTSILESFYGSEFVSYLEMEGIFDQPQHLACKTEVSTAHSSGIKLQEPSSSTMDEEKIAGSPLSEHLAGSTQSSGAGSETVKELLSQINSHVQQALQNQHLKTCFCQRHKTPNSQVLQSSDIQQAPNLTMSGWAKLHPELTYQMRHKLLDWMREYSAAAKLKRKSYHLAVELLDRYLSCFENLDKRQFQLLGSLCLLLASKNEDNLLNFWDLKYLMPTPQMEAKAKALEYDICIVGGY